MEVTAALSRLVDAYLQHGPDAAVLPAVRKACDALQVVPADRSYRYAFTENYVLLLREDLDYRPEILNAAMLQEPDLWVNGNLHHISPATMQKGRHLRKCFLQICDLLAHPGREVSLLVSGRLKRALSVFEQAWVRYEESYVRDLIVIETFARRPLERAVHVELALLELEYPSDSRRKPPTPTQPTLIPKPVGLQPPQLTAPTERPSDSAHARDRTASAATEPSLPHRHRHPDLRAEDFSAFSHDSECECPRSRQQTRSGEAMAPAAAAAVSAAQTARAARKCELRHLAFSAASCARHSPRRLLLEELLHRVGELNACANAKGKGRQDMTVSVLEAAADSYLTEDRANDPTSRARKALACAVLEGFLEVRHYLSAVSMRMLWIDPQLSSNEDLEGSLMAWEDAWELGTSFLLKPELRDAICGVAADTSCACEFEPTLAGLIEDQDAELFMILPRLVLLSGLRSPSHLALAQEILPELEAPVQEGAQPYPFAELRQALGQLSIHQGDGWQFLMAKAIQGPGQAAADERGRAVEAFLRQLEGFSIQLQRKQPEVWNRCCCLLLRCVSAAADSTCVAL
ncbi:unnamed protein product [Effrenium voratum]|uniref:Uncharacterized protein n=1 Tax=Effrenium voratum TaxID=2562239 RepID=A0AA36J035_9DINO|nr:unnamed protein product [Effrenium voratum]